MLYVANIAMSEEMEIVIITNRPFVNPLTTGRNLHIRAPLPILNVILRI
jgi:hypothetical protein